MDFARHNELIVGELVFYNLLQNSKGCGKTPNLQAKPRQEACLYADNGQNVGFLHNEYSILNAPVRQTQDQDVMQILKNLHLKIIYG